MNGEGIKSLTGFRTRSAGSSDLHSERAEVGTESLLSRFINQKLAVKGSFKSWFRKVKDWKKLRFRKIGRSERLSSDDRKLFIERLIARPVSDD
jgi:hypothetical protein